MKKILFWILLIASINLHAQANEESQIINSDHQENFDDFLGVYAADDFPLKITISLKEGALIGQATGQPSFPLKKIGDGKFSYEDAGLSIEFKQNGKILILQQAGAEFELIKETN